MFNKSIINNFVKIGIKTWLKSICTRIDIHTLNLVLNKNCFGKVDEIYLEADNLIYQDVYINHIIIKINDCNLKFNYKNHLIYSEDLIINTFLTINNRNLENTFYSSKWERIRLEIEKAITEGQFVSSLIINNNLIKFTYDINKFSKEIILSLCLKENFIFLKNINNKKKFLLPLDKNINFKNCHINNELINIDLSSKVTFDN